MDDDEQVTLPPLRPPLANSSAPRDLEPSDAVVEKVKKWQEERLERRLRGEYESAVLHLGELINTNIDVPSRIAGVRIEGATHTRPSFLHWLVKPHLAHVVDDLSTLGDVLRTTSNLSRTLLETDIYSFVHPRLDRSRNVLASDGDIDLVLQTKEKGRFFFKTATEFGDQDGSASVQGRIRNVFGGAEIVEASVSSGFKTRLAGHISLSAPISPSLRTQGELSVFGLERDMSAFASCVEGVRGLRAVVRSTSRSTVSEFAYEAALRHVRGLSPTASVSIREAAGHSLKSSLSHTWVRDTRNDRAVPSSGTYLRTCLELAGLGGDVAFGKSQMNFQIARKLFPGSYISFSGRAGYLCALLGRQSLFNDRFQLGGPLDVRLFKQNGLGPRDGVDSLGGDLFWTAGLSVISDLPNRPEWPVKSHVFLNAGRLDSVDKERTLAQNISACISKPSISAGVGILYRLGAVRVEANFGVPLVASGSDAHRRGFQLGIGLDFL